MIAILRLEEIAQLSDVQILERRMGHRHKSPRTRSKPWVAKIVGTHPTYGLDREFLGDMRDHYHQTRSGLRGVWQHFALYSGFVYEAKELLSTRRARRFFCKAHEGRVVEVDREEVDRWVIENACVTSLGG